MKTINFCRVLLILVTFGLGTPFYSVASHLIGADLTYTCTSNPNIYTITVKVYRDCSGVQMCANCPTILSPYCGISVNITGAATPSGSGLPVNPYTGVSYGTQTLTVVPSASAFDIIQLCSAQKSICNNCGTRTPGGYVPGIEVYTFRGTVNLSSLPSSCCLVSIGFGSCCRSNVISLLQPTDNYFYSEVIINRCLSACNSAPAFRNQPIIEFCSGQDFSYNPGVFDPDGDSLSYALGPVLTGPGAPATYVSPYSPTVPFPYFGAPLQSPPASPPIGIYIDQANGDIFFRPMGSFSSNLVILVKKWRKVGGNHVLAGTIERDITVISKICPNNLLPQTKTYTSSGQAHTGSVSYVHNLKVNEPNCFIISANDTQFDTTDISWILPDTLINTGATITPLYDPLYRSTLGPKSDSVKFCWTPPSYMARNKPYYFLHIAQDRNCPFSGKSSRSFAIYVRNNTLMTDSSKSFCSGDSLWMGCSNVSGFSLQWYLNGSPLPGGNFQYFYAKFPGVYQVVRFDGSNPVDTTDALTVTMNIATPATVTGSTTFCYGGSTQLKGNEGSGLHYQWLHNGSVITGQTGKFLTINTPGSYKLILKNEVGCKDTSTNVSVSGFQKKFATLNAMGSLEFCIDDSVRLQSGPDTIVKRKWFRNNVFLNDSESVFYQAKFSGNYSVLCFDSTGCTDTSIAVAVTVHPKPAATIDAGSSIQICSNSSLTIQANLGANLSYQWFKNDLPLTGVTTGTLVVYDSGTYYVKVSQPPIGCSSLSNTVNLRVLPAPEASIFTSGPTEFCIGNSVVLKTVMQSGITYRWLRNSLFTGVTVDTLKVTTGGAYQLVATQTNLCRDTSETQLVVVDSFPPANLTPQGLVDICSGENLILMANTGPRLNYEWYKNDTVLSGKTNYTYNVAGNGTGNGTYKVKVTIGAGCSTLSNSASVTVQPKPGPFMVNGPHTVQKDIGNWFTVPPIPGVYTNWGTTGTVVSGQGTDSAWIVMSNFGLYSLRVSRYFVPQCSTERIFTINVSLTGLDDPTSMDYFTIAPNPVNQELKLNFRNAPSDDIHIGIYDIQGRRIEERIDASRAQNFNIPVGNFAPGTYLLEVKLNGSRVLKRFIKQ